VSLIIIDTLHKLKEKHSNDNQPILAILIISSGKGRGIVYGYLID
jgi:hypothetical protein